MLCTSKCTFASAVSELSGHGVVTQAMVFGREVYRSASRVTRAVMALFQEYRRAVEGRDAKAVISLCDESFTDDGWLKTGDVCTVDANGYMRIVDRTKDVVKSGGEWISSVDLERVIKANVVLAIPGTEGIEVEVLDLRTLKPLDEEAVLATARKTGRVVVLTEEPQTGSFAGEVAARVAEKAFWHLDAPVARVCCLDTPVPYSPPLEDYYLPNADKLIARVRELLRA